MSFSGYKNLEQDVVDRSYRISLLTVWNLADDVKLIAGMLYVWYTAAVWIFEGNVFGPFHTLKEPIVYIPTKFCEIS